MIKKTKNKSFILLLCLFVLFGLFFNNSNLVTQENSDNNKDKDSTFYIKYIWGELYVRELGENVYNKSKIGEVLTYDYEIKLEDGSRCIITPYKGKEQVKVFEASNNENEVKIKGPINLRVKDLLENQEVLNKVNLNDRNINRIINIFNNNNNKLIVEEYNSEIDKRGNSNLKSIINIMKESFYERAFSIAYDYIKEVRNTSYIQKEKPPLYNFYYVVAQISFKTLNLSIAESSIYKLINDTKIIDDIDPDRKKIETRQKTYILASLIYAIKSEYNTALDYIDRNIQEFSDDVYFKERIGYITYFIQGIIHLNRNDIEKSEISFQQAIELCQSSIENNLRTFEKLLKMQRTPSVQYKIDKYYVIINEASLILGYIKDRYE
ncbi:MAG: hypothetical protein ACOCV8_02560 [Spirochaetota bacterium]